MAKKKPKPMTAKEKQCRKEVRERLRKEGIIPPVKQRLNRKQFANEVRSEYESGLLGYGDEFYLFRALGVMLPSKELNRPINEETVGVLKLVKMAIELKRFDQRMSAEGRKEFTVGEVWDTVIRPVLKL